MSTSNVLVNDTVKLKVKFLDQDINGNQVEATMSSVNVKIVNSKEEEIVNTLATAVSGSLSEYYYNFTPTIAGAYAVTFTGITAGSPSKTIVSRTNIYASTSTTEYKPTVTLRADETILFAPDLYPLYLDPEELLSIFPDASLIEIGEMIYHYSLEIKEIYGLGDDVDGSTLPFTILEYIKAAAACELSRTYGFGGDDELSLKLGDLEITNRSAPRQVATRSNATTWCQIAASLRREVLAKKVSMKGVMPKGYPSIRTRTSGKRVDPQTGKMVYLSDIELMGPGRTVSVKDEPEFDRGLRQYD
jgi:hypothetical protein